MSLKLAGIRQEYSKQELSPDDCLSDPIAQFELWFNEAMTSEVPEPTAMHVASVGPDGHPSGRVVLLKGVEDGQFLFYTNYLSRKGRQISDNPYVALTFFWPELERQIRVEGRAMQLPGPISDEYFASRPYTSRLGAWASEQSTEIPSKVEIVKRVAMRDLCIARYEAFGSAGQASKIKAIGLEAMSTRYTQGELTQIIK